LRLTWCVEDDGVDPDPLLEGGDEDGDHQLGPVTAAQDGHPGVDYRAGDVDGVDDVLQSTVTSAKPAATSACRVP